MMKFRKKMNKESGQSTIEFLSAFVFVITLLFVYIKMAVNITNGYLVHYGTFIASRAYLVFDNNEDFVGSDGGAATKANEVFDSVVFNFEGSGTSKEVFGPDEPNNPVYVGYVASFEQRFAFSNLMGGAEPIEFISESFLGREPSRSECVSQVVEAIKDAVIDCEGAGRGHCTIGDNGC